MFGSGAYLLNISKIALRRFNIVSQHCLATISSALNDKTDLQQLYLGVKVIASQQNAP